MGLQSCYGNGIWDAREKAENPADRRRRHFSSVVQVAGMEVGNRAGYVELNAGSELMVLKGRLVLF